MVIKRGRKSAWETKIKPRLKEIEAWCRDGLIYDQIAKNLGVHLATLMKYKSENKEFSDILKKGREVVDMQVENALLKRALGFEYEEEHEEWQVGPDGKTLVRANKKKIKKKVLPDTTAQIFWLKNRQQVKWRDRKTIDSKVEISYEQIIDQINDAE